jgi:hypothetical protein
LLIVQPILWGGVAIAVSVMTKRRRLRTDFYGLAAGIVILLIGQLALLTNFQTSSSYIDTLLKTFAASLILPLGLLPALPRRGGLTEDFEDDEEEEEE